MDSDDIDNELEMQNETNEDILFGFDVEDDDEASGVIGGQTETDSDGSDFDFQLADMQSDAGDTDR